MFELLIAVCVKTSLCQYVAPQVAYESAESCRLQAALVAGVVAGQHPPASAISWRYRCQETGAEAPASAWIDVVLAELPQAD